MTTYLAPAKVNLHLAVTGMTDDGLHTLDTSFVYVDVADVLDVSLAKDLMVTCSDPHLNGSDNLVFTLLQAFREKYGVKKGVHVFVDKKLPSQAGLGGGSSDAATALMVANDLWNVGCTRDELIHFAKKYGADIPCFLFGEVSVAKGVGEQLLPYPEPISEGFVVLAWPGEGVSTKQAFKHFDKKQFHALTDEKSAVKVRARLGDSVFHLGYNDLEESAVELCKPLKKLLSTMRKQSPKAWMSGSGSACVALFDSKNEAELLAAMLTNETLASWVHVGQFVQKHPMKEKIGA